MADRTIVTRLRAEVSDFKRQMGEAAKSTEAIGDKAKQSSQVATTSLGRMAQSAQNNRESWDRAGTALTGFGVAALAGLGVATNAAMNWESAWTGVLKTVEGSDAELAALEGSLREMARTLPATHEEIAAVAEAAGQLGVQTPAIAAFTETMVALGETTNLTADEAATSIAQLMNVMQTAPADVDNLGAALVQLGNNGASTERDIIFMAQRIAGAGKIVGLTEGEVLGLANALSSVGIEVEAGGTAISTIMTDMAKAVSTGSDDLGKFAEVAGITADEFATSFNEDPADAIATFVEGLGRINESGGDVFTTLDDLGQSEVRVTRALLTMANSGDLLRESLAMGNEAWAENSALVAEAAQRYDTTEAKLQIAKNGLNDAAITIGETFLPMVADAAGGVADLAEWISGLPEPVLTAGAVLGGLAGVAATVGGGFLLLAPRVMDTVSAFKTLRTDMPDVASKMGKVGKAAGIASAAIAGVAAAGALLGSESSGRSVAQFTDELLRLGDASSDLELTGNATYDLGEAWDRITNPGAIDRFDDWLGNITQLVGAKSDAQLLAEEFEGLGQSLASMYASNPDLAAAKFQQMLELTGATADELLEKVPAYRDALLDADNQQAAATAGAEGLAGALDETGVAADEAEAELSDLAKSLQGVGEAFVDPLAIYTEQMQAMAQATADSTEDAEDSWADYVDGVTVSLDDYAAELEAQIAAQEEWATNIGAISERGGAEVASILAAMGVEGARLTDEMANATGEDFERMKNALIEDARLGGEGAAREMETWMAIMEEKGRLGAGATAAAIAENLGIGVAEVARIAKGYGVELALGINPVLAGLGRPPIRASGDIAPTWQADGSVLNAGSESHVAQIAPAGAWRVWAEDETGGESYIPLAPAKRRRSLDIWRETGRRLGAKFEEFAYGGFSGVNDVPRPYSLGQYRPPISSPAQAGMEEMYSEVIAYIKENSIAAHGGDIVGLGRKLAQMGFRISGHPSFGGVVAGGHRPGSLHYAGRAIDVNYGPGGQNAIETAAINALMPQLAGMRFAEKIWQAPGHFDHLHLAMAKGGILNPHIRDTGGPLRPGYTYNGTGANEMVVPSMKYATAAGYNPAAPAPTANTLTGPLHIEGTLDLGNGLTGFVRGIAHMEAVGAVRSSQERPRR